MHLFKYITHTIYSIIYFFRLVFGGVTAGRFSYVFIDESGHCTEPQVLIPIAGIITNEESSRLLGKIILAGDPKQLGPIIHSKLALQQGLGNL